MSQSHLKNVNALLLLFIGHSIPLSSQAAVYRFARSRPRRLVFLILLPIPEKSLLLPAIGAFQSSLEQACNCISDDMDCIAFLRCMSAVRRVLITFLINPLSHCNSKLQMFEVNKWTQIIDIFTSFQGHAVLFL